MKNDKQAALSQRIVILNWEAISAAGVGAAALQDSAACATPVPGHPLETCAGDFTAAMSYRPAHFNIATLLGKGTRTMDRTTALAVGTAQLLHCERPVNEEASAGTGFVIGTSTGSIRSASDFTRDSLEQERPYLVNPALFPNTVMNCAAGQCAIRFHARSVNATVAGGRLSGLLAFLYAFQMLRRGYADRLFAGAVEELCPQTSWAHQMLVKQARRLDTPLGEGCALFELARASEASTVGQGVVAEILALQYGRCFGINEGLQEQPPVAVAAYAMKAMQACNVRSEDLAAICLCSSAEALAGEIERSAASRFIGPDTQVHSTSLIERLGDTYSASFSLALGYLLSTLRVNPQGSQVGMVLVAREDGHTGVLLVRARPEGGAA